MTCSKCRKAEAIFKWKGVVLCGHCFQGTSPDVVRDRDVRMADGRKPKPAPATAMPEFAKIVPVNEPTEGATK